MTSRRARDYSCTLAQNLKACSRFVFVKLANSDVGSMHYNLAATMWESGWKRGNDVGRRVEIERATFEPHGGWRKVGNVALRENNRGLLR